MEYSLERRKCPRFRINLNLRFTVMKNGTAIETGAGRILDVSKGGIYFECARLMEPGTVLRLNIEWPVTFSGIANVEWVVESVVARSGLSGPLSA